ncbi:MAG: GTPase [Thermodesulfobacteriota bacterium]|nr:GTPase [Thermodesulfobacteriota bacterium]
MPANLPPQYFEAEKDYRLAKTTQEKIAALEAMLTIMPKHKGTDKLRGQLRKRISKLKGEAQKKYTTSKKAFAFNIDREGAAQVMLIGPPNVGKSELLSKVTKASPEVADYPFTTRKPLAGMMSYENIQIQLVDTPPIATGYVEPWLFGIIRNSDGMLLMVDLSEDPLEQLESTIEELKKSNIHPIGNQQIEKDMCKHAVKQTLIIANKNDLDSSYEIYDILKELYAFKFPIISISAREEDNLDGMKKQVFQMLKIIRVYTKAPGKTFDPNAPFILKEGKTVQDLSEKIHKDFAKRFKYAKIWGSEKYKGQMVQKEYILKDGDVLELHM